MTFCSRFLKITWNTAPSTALLHTAKIYCTITGLHQFYKSLNPYELEKFTQACIECLLRFEYDPLKERKGNSQACFKNNVNLSKMAEVILGEGSAAAKLRN